ncbi:ankyrin repeat-containing domain protein [Aspergillus stella-maris]|uniref:ankyrin repeat-containing domain protein n=1 Tax=Aspergillus stella-maris TaxID=1810926 RepID=UPI003CCE50C6
MPKSAPRIRNEVWEQHKEEISSLYLERKWTLDQVMAVMRDQHGFEASPNQYRAKLKAWKVGKNTSSDVWRFVEVRLRRRQLEGKNSQVLLYGQVQPWAKVMKEIARNVPLIATIDIPENASSLDEVVILTPPSSPVPDSEVSNGPQNPGSVLAESTSGQRPWDVEAPDTYLEERPNYSTSSYEPQSLVRTICDRLELFHESRNETLSTSWNPCDSGLHINELWQRPDGREAFLAVIRRQCLEEVLWCIQNGASVNPPPSFDHDTPLQVAAQLEWFDGAKCLLESGAKAECPANSIGRQERPTALRWSLVNRDMRMMELLMGKGADVDAVSAGGPGSKSALSLQIDQESEYESIAPIIEDNLKVKGSFYVIAALRAAVGPPCGDHRVFELLIDKMANIGESLRQRKLLEAWNNLQFHKRSDTTIKIIKLFLKAGVDINSRETRSKSTLLQRSLTARLPGYSPDARVAMFLLDSGAAFDIPAGRNIGTPLQEAILSKIFKIAYLMLDRGADPNVRCLGYYISSPLEAAVQLREIDVIERILMSSGNVSIEPAFGAWMKATRMASGLGLKRILLMLLSACPRNMDLKSICVNLSYDALDRGYHDIADWLREYPATR